MSKYKIILDVYNTHSISKTAENFNYTQSAVSQAIKSYEKELGVPLFKRTKHGMLPLPNTSRIMESLEEICNAESNIARVAESINSLTSGYIRIGTIQSVSYNWLPEILEKFNSEYPNVTFQLYIGGFNELSEKLSNNELDIIFTSEYASKDFQFYPIGTDELMLVSPREHPLSKKLTVSIQDVDKESYILSSDGLAYETGRIFELNGISPSIKFEMNDDFAVIKMVQSNFGITILPKLLLYNIPFDVCVRSFSEHYYRTLGIAVLKNSVLSPAIQKLIEFAENHSADKNLL